MVKQISLYNTEGSSNKEYHITILEVDGGFMVETKHGGRGKTLKALMKTANPVDLDAATKIYNTILKKQLNKGYYEGEDGVAYQAVENKEHSGLTLKLLSEINKNSTHQSVAQYLNDDDYWMQQKMDGERRAIIKNGKAVLGVNRKGFIVPLPEPVVNEVLAIDHDQLTIDGEIIGDDYYAFDILSLDDKVTEGESYVYRYGILKAIDWEKFSQLNLVIAVQGKSQKEALLSRLEEALGEGAVFKHKHNDEQVKYKFIEDCTVQVSHINEGKRSVGIHVFDGNTQVAVGNVTIPANATIPNKGDLIDVQYLYYYEGGSLFQPVYKCPRLDLSVSDCRLDKLKLKGDGQAVA